MYGFACTLPYTLARDNPVSRLLALLCHSFAQTIAAGTGISTCCPSPTLFASD